MFGSIIYLLFPKTEKRTEVSQDMNHRRSEQVLPGPGVGVGWCPACPIPVLGNRDRERWRRQRQGEMWETEAEKQRQRPRWERDRHRETETAGKRDGGDRDGAGRVERHRQRKQAPENPPGRGPREPGSPGVGWGTGTETQV